MEAWDSFALAPGDRLRWAVRNVRLCFERDAQSWWVGQDTEANTLLGAEISSKPISEAQDRPTLTWQRWAFGEVRPLVAIRPAVPDRPLVVKTSPKTIVPPSCRATFFFSIPIWAAVAIPSLETPDILTDLVVIPGERLSSTWFGDFQTGVLCYALPFTMTMDPGELVRDPLTAICTFTVFNKSQSDLPIEKISVQASHLAIFRAQERLWTNEVFVSVKSDGDASRVRFGQQPPRQLERVSLLRAAEHTDNLNPLKRTFRFSHSR